MSADHVEFTGAMTALVTPFREDGSIDFDAYGQLVERQIAGGIDALVPCGTTGESATMSHDEHEEVVSFAVKTAAGRVKVLAGAGSNNTAEAVRLTRSAAEAGADGALLVSPYYNKPTQEGLFLHHKAIGEATGDFPQVLYNVPGRTGKEIAVETVVRLAGLPCVAGIKEAGGSVDRVSSILAACDICLVSGDDSLTVPMISVGARGIISVIANLVPANVKKMTDAALGGDFETARALHYKMLPLVRLCFIENNPMGIKTIMHAAGLPAGSFRPPLCDMQAGSVKKTEAALAEYGSV
ncbi:MAG: 4-hydroxy-tetrahydrodipicolinate synthase [Planctomycetota bacterium]|jgi:4-hydroxy-tetrahydrodipicolinate synthase